MLGRMLKLTLDGMEVGTTPMLVPSISSRINLPIPNLIKTVEGVVNGPFLISSFDYYHYGKPKVNFPELLFLDSGGYECSSEHAVTDIGFANLNPLDWNESLHKSVIDEWEYTVPTVMVSFDHPLIRESTHDQIERALKLFDRDEKFLKELLLKPETKSSFRVHYDEIARNIDSYSQFDIIGFTEKELGGSILEKLITISRVRKLLDESGLEIPIHVFGGLDVVTTPLYFMAGADIFDGLSWLRFLFNAGDTLYVESFGPKRFGIEVNEREVWIKSVDVNYTEFLKLKLDLVKFSKTEDYDIFDTNASFFRKSVELLESRIGDS